MSKRDKNRPPTEGELLERQIFTERLTAREKRLIAQQKEQVDDLAETNRAIETAERDGLEEGEEIHRADGKVLKGRGTKHQYASAESQLKKIFGEDALSNGIFLSTVKMVRNLIEHSIATPSILTKTFGPKADIALPDKYEDEHYLYDTMQVSDPIYHKLIQESEIIAAKVKQLEGIREPNLREMFERQITEMATKFEMRVHPITQKYVHDIARVMREEARHAEHVHLSSFKLGAKNHLICIFQLKNEMGDVRGIKAQVADVCETDNVAEVRTSGQHVTAEAKGPNAPAPS